MGIKQGWNCNQTRFCHIKKIRTCEDVYWKAKENQMKRFIIL